MHIYRLNISFETVYTKIKTSVAVQTIHLVNKNVKTVHAYVHTNEF